MTETITRAELIDILSYALQVLKKDNENPVEEEVGTMATDPMPLRTITLDELWRKGQLCGKGKCALTKEGYETLNQIACERRYTILTIDNLGGKSFDQISDALKKYGLQFADD